MEPEPALQTREDFAEFRLHHLRSEVSELSFSGDLSLGLVRALALLMFTAFTLYFLMNAEVLMGLFFGFLTFSFARRRPSQDTKRTPALREILYEFSQIPLTTSQHFNTALVLLQDLPLRAVNGLEPMYERELTRVLEAAAHSEEPVRLTEGNRLWVWGRLQKGCTPFTLLRMTEERGRLMNALADALASTGTSTDYLRCYRWMEAVPQRERTGTGWKAHEARMSRWQARLEAEKLGQTLLRPGSVPPENLLSPVLNPPEEAKEILLRSVGTEEGL